MKPKYSVGQIVYRQSYAMPNFYSTAIYEIQLAEHSKKDGTEEWVYRVRPPYNPTTGYNWVGEEDLFYSPLELKTHWIKTILDIKEM